MNTNVNLNRAAKAALANSQANPFQLRVSYFHSSTVLERRRRTHWDCGGGSYEGSSKKFNNYSKRTRRLNTKRELLRNVSQFAEHLFQSWQHEREDTYSGYSSRHKHGYRENPFEGAESRNRGNQGRSRRRFDFCKDDDVEIEVETIFRSAFGGNRYYFWSFMNEEPQWRNSSRNFNNHRTSWRWSHEYEEEEDSSSESESVRVDLSSDRLALGLKASGPLSLDEVKLAYRECALKWHPDRHQGSSKVVAEEKFKICSAAYQSLCDKLTPA